MLRRLESVAGEGGRRREGKHVKGINN
jgi:hypothetical protein